MIPLNVTHKAILTASEHIRMKGLTLPQSSNIITDSLLSLDPTSMAELLSQPATTPFRNTMSTMLSFFAATYASTFNFTLGPPLHDPLTIAYIAYPEMFKTRRYRVDVDCGPQGAHGVGQTVVDVWEYRECDTSWGAGGKNVIVAEDVDVSSIFRIKDFSWTCVTL